MAFHWKDGWYFERMREEKYGWVRIYHIPPGESVADVDIEIEPNSWASIMASVCPEGETQFTFNITKALHGVLSYMP